MADNTHETRQITQVESHCVNYQIALQVIWSCLHWSLGMGFFSSLITQLMQVLLSKRQNKHLEYTHRYI